jgi:chromosome segregation ATPase
MDLDQFQQCQEVHEQALQRNRDLEQELKELQAKQNTICKYCSELCENNLSIFTEFSSCGVGILHDSLVNTPIVETIKGFNLF